MPNKIAVITLVSGREQALRYFIKGLNSGLALPDELVVVFMNEDFYELPETDFPIKFIRLNSVERFPLASARNLGAQNASFDHLIFLDVDCIPEKSLVQKYSDFNDEALYSGAVKYLPKKAMLNLDLDRLEALSYEDPIRSEIQELPYELFWSLNFACSRRVFDTIGGFNEAYKGYGAEDTDFAFRARAHQIPLKNVPVTVYHQYHDSYDPPLNHFDAIVNNARLFFKLWGKWPMEGWLKKFQEMGFLEWDAGIKVIKKPSEKEIAMAVKRDSFKIIS